MRWRVWVAAGAVLAGAPAWAEERVVFTVWFADGSAELSAEARKTIAEASVRAKACEHNGVRVIGHTDTALAPGESDALGKARGTAVGDALKARGVSGSAMSAIGHGENRLAVATADGVREPKNNRAEIILVCD